MPPLCLFNMFYSRDILKIIAIKTENTDSFCNLSTPCLYQERPPLSNSHSYSCMQVKTATISIQTSQKND